MGSAYDYDKWKKVQKYFKRTLPLGVVVIVSRKGIDYDKNETGANVVYSLDKRSTASSGL